MMTDGVSLREHIEALLRSHEGLHGDVMAAHLALHARELTVAEDKVRVLENRLQGMNEFRAALNDAQKTFATRDMLDARDDALNKRLGLMENRWANLDGRMALFALVPIGISVASFIYAITK